MQRSITPDVDLSALFGPKDRNLEVLENLLSVQVMVKGSEVCLSGNEEQLQLAVQVIDKLCERIAMGDIPDTACVRYGVELAKKNMLDRLNDALLDPVAITHRGRPIRCKTLGQTAYVNAIRSHELTIVAGPAGTGKTYLAMAMAVMALKNREVERIVLTRPAVEAGEKLGFLPGDMSQKVDPYLRPLYDALYEMMGVDSYQRLTEKGTVEVAPLAFMRGRTLSDAFIILDEAQNTTCEQMKMFLTRLGAGSKCVVTGDISQIDLPKGRMSGLVEALEVLKDEPAVGIVRLAQGDVIRHELVRKIVSAYDRYEAAKGEKGGADGK